MTRNKREPWLDWDGSLELAKKSRQQSKRKRPTKTLFWARFWLILGAGFFSNLYLRRSLPACLWLFVLFAYNIFSFFISEFAKGLPPLDLFLLTLITFVPYVLMISIEWAQLPKRVRNYNANIVGKHNLKTDELRGEIGRYAMLKKHLYSIIVVFALGAIAFEIEKYGSPIYAMNLSICFTILFQLLFVSFIIRAYKISRKSKLDLESHIK